MRILAVTDIHNGYHVENKRHGHRAVPLLKEHFLPMAAQSDLVVNCGDDIHKSLNALNALADKQTLRDAWRTLPDDTHHVDIPGNHDEHAFSRENLRRISGKPVENYTFQKDGIFFVFWMANTTPKRSRIGEDPVMTANDHHLKWLQETLQKIKGPVILFSHLPLNYTDDRAQKIATQPIEGHNRNYNPFWYFYTNTQDIQEIIKGTGNVMLAIGGHRHRFDYLDLNGTHYVTLPSFTQANPNNRSQASCSFGEITLTPDQCSLKIHGAIQPEQEIQRKLQNLLG